ncbi:hypothetical protein RHGRI_023929 [Rhododendron griersonianum]|uniref:Uncharacterized protein n=1 Tax=Rhododendron griersonianum TaxID=479676 RepID=A0AAV6JCM8_9ERIC|nr:hypothetical protein RHGRI_023929 [Rhododendron griersonianum]
MTNANAPTQCSSPTIAIVPSSKLTTQSFSTSSVRWPAGHCDQGLKMIVKVLEPESNPPPPPTPPSSTTESSSTTGVAVKEAGIISSSAVVVLTTMSFFGALFFM